MAEKMARRRVKLYALNPERQWDDRGTGHVTSTSVYLLAHAIHLKLIMHIYMHIIS